MSSVDLDNATRFAVARIHSDLADGETQWLDTSFGGDGTVLAQVGASAWSAGLVIQPDGKIVIARDVYWGDSYWEYDFALARFQENGELDASFGTSGIVTTDFYGGGDGAWFVTMQDDGRLIAVGWAQVNPPGESPTVLDMAVARYRPDGKLDAFPIGVLHNDSDPNEDALTATLVTGPAHGNVKFYADGTFEYRPSPGYVGFDSFTYTADDGVYQSAPATVTIAVGQVAADAGGPYTIDEGRALLLNGSQSVDLEGGPLTYAWDLDADGLYDDASGATPTISWAQVSSYGLADDTAHPVTVRVEDGDGHSHTATTEWTVRNLAPQAAAEESTVAVTEGETAANPNISRISEKERELRHFSSA